jgi:predicted Ser/Thr protein kinase
MAEVNTFEQVIKADRAARESKQWRGTLLDYLELVKGDPTVTKMSHAPSTI